MQTITGPDGRGNEIAGAAAAGYALLLSAVPQGRGRVLDISVGAARLAAMPPGALVGTRVASAVHLADPVEPNTVLTHLRTAAGTPGPLVVYVLGQVSVDRRQQRPHIALARTTEQTTRYTALPWAWLAAALRDRPAGSLTVLADLVATDARTWQVLSEDPGQLAGALPLFGVLSPPPRRRRPAAPHYTYAVADLLRAGDPPDSPGRLHRLALAHSGLEGSGALVFHGGPAAVAPVAYHPAYRPGPPLHEEPVHEEPVYRGPVYGEPPAPLTAAVPAPAAARGVLPEAAVPEPEAPAWRAGSVAPEPVRRAPAPPEPVRAEGASYPPVPDPRGTPPSAPPSEARRAPVPDPRRGPLPDPGSGPGAGGGVNGSGQRRAARPDPHAAIGEAARAGRFGEAYEIVSICERNALRGAGPSSAEALHWQEVRADLAMLAGDSAAACSLWMGVAQARMAIGEAASAGAVSDAVDRAHHCWGKIGEPETALRLAVALVPLRERVPGRQPGAVAKLLRRVTALSALSAGPAGGETAGRA